MKRYSFAMCALLIVWFVTMLVAQPAAAQRSGERGAAKTPTPAAEAQSAGDDSEVEAEELTTAMNHLRGWRTKSAREVLEAEKESGAADTPQLKMAWAWLKAEEGELEEAVEELSSVASTAKGDPAPEFLRGEVLLMQDRMDAASKAWAAARERAKAVLEADEADPRALYYLGASLVRLRKFADARKVLQEALESDWNDAAVRYQLGLSYVFERNWSDGIEQLTDAIDADPKLAHAYYYRGLAWHQQGRVDKALNDLDLFVQMAPDAPEADSARTILEAGQR